MSAAFFTCLIVFLALFFSVYAHKWGNTLQEAFYLCSELFFLMFYPFLTLKTKSVTNVLAPTGTHSYHYFFSFLRYLLVSLLFPRNFLIVHCYCVWESARASSWRLEEVTGSGFPPTRRLKDQTGCIILRRIISNSWFLHDTMLLTLTSDTLMIWSLPSNRYLEVFSHYLAGICEGCHVGLQLVWQIACVNFAILEWI